MDEQKFVILPS